MRYRVLASDYDGTLAKDGVVDPDTIEALDRFRQSGRKLVMVTGRELTDLKSVFHRFDLFDCIVAENGALLYWPLLQVRRALSEKPNQAFIDALKERGVRPLSVGETIVATVHPYETMVLDVIRDLGLDLQITFNKGSVMVLPPTVNKLTGLSAVLTEWDIAPEAVVGVGDAENDHAFLHACGYSVAVSNALPSVKETANLTTVGHHGAGVVELIDMILGDRLG